MRWAYERNKKVKNKTLDFSDVIWDYDIEPIIDYCKSQGIDYITISSTYSSLITTLAEFEKHDCKIGGLTEVKSEHKDWETGLLKHVPAIIVRI